MPGILDNSQRFRYAIIFQWVVVGISIISLASEAAEYFLLQKMASGTKVPHSQVEANDWRQQVVSSTQLVLMLLSFIAMVLWAYRAYENLHRLHKMPRPQYSEGAAGWGWFVPVLNLWYPYQVMKDIWYLTQRYAQPDDAPRFERDRNLIGGWWGLRLFTFFAGRGIRAPSDGATMDQIQNYVLSTMCMNIMHIWCAVTVIYLLRKIRPFEQQLAVRFTDDRLESSQEEVPQTPTPVWYGPVNGDVQ